MMSIHKTMYYVIRNAIVMWRFISLCQLMFKQKGTPVNFQLNFVEHARFVFSSCGLSTGIECSRYFDENQVRSLLTITLQSQKFCFS